MLNNQLMALRKKCGMTQEELAEKIAVARQTIANWEAGISAPNVEMLCRLADYFEITLDELLGRKNPGAKEKEGYSRKTLGMFELGEKLLKCSQLSRREGLLALEQIGDTEGSDNGFLKFAIGFLLDMCTKGIPLERSVELLQNYSKNEPDYQSAAMVIDALRYIWGGEPEAFLCEVVASHLGRAYRDKFANTRNADRIQREELLKSYENAPSRYPDTHLLDGVLEYSDKSIQIVLRGITVKALGDALNGASGKVCRKFLSNLNERMLYFIDEDIRRFQGTEEEVEDAQREIMKTAENLGITKL